MAGSEERNERLCGERWKLAKSRAAQNRWRAQAIFGVRLDDAREGRVAAGEREIAILDRYEGAHAARRRGSDDAMQSAPASDDAAFGEVSA